MAFEKLYRGVNELDAWVTSANEFVVTSDLRQAINELELRIYEARKVFGRRKI